MKICPECKLSVGGSAVICPLCGSKLLNSSSAADDISLYPDFSIPTKPRSKFPFLAKLFAFISLVAILVCGFIDLILNHRFTWSLFVIGGIAVLWVSLGTHLLTDINLNYKLMLDLCALSLYLILIDKLTGWKQWSVDYVIPILYIGVMITTIVLALVFREFWREYILSLIAICLLGLGPLFIFFTSKSPMRYLCLAAAILAAVLLIGLLFFASGKLFSEWKRRMKL